MVEFNLSEKICAECRKPIKISYNHARNKNNKIICDDCYSK